MFRNFLTAFTTSLPKLIPLFVNLKGYIFADGKFDLQRSLVLLLSLIILVVALQYTGVADLTVIIGLLDEISDIFGYS